MQLIGFKMLIILKEQNNVIVAYIELLFLFLHTYYN